MSNEKLDDIFMMGVDGKSYQELLEIAKKQNKSVGEVASEALRRHIDSSQELKESTDKRLLMEG